MNKEAQQLENGKKPIKKVVKFLKIVFKSLIVLALVLALYDAVMAITGMSNSFGKLFTKHDVVPTSTIIRNVSNTAELTSAVYNDEFVVAKTKYNATFFFDEDGDMVTLAKAFEDPSDLMLGNKDRFAPWNNGFPEYDEYYINEETKEKICYIIKDAQVRAGYDLSKLTSDDAIICGDTLKIYLPPAEIFDVIINPSNAVIFDEQGSWDEASENEIFKDINDSLRQKAIEKGILNLAKESAEKLLFNLFRTFGYENVILYFNEDTNIVNHNSVSMPTVG